MQISNPQAGLGVEDRFTAFYYCVGRNVTFDVLGE